MLEELVHQVEARLKAIGKQLLTPSPRAALEQQIERLDEEVVRCRESLRQAGHERAAAQRRLRVNRDLIARLPGIIRRALEAGNKEEAWHHALALDRARQEAAVDNEALPRLGQVCWSLHFQARQIERQLDHLRQQLAGLKDRA